MGATPTTPVTLARLRDVAATTTHVAGLEAELLLSDGSTAVVADPPAPGIDADDFRAAVVEALATGRLDPVVRLVDPAARPVQAVLRAGPGFTALDHGTRWRRTCACGTTDYLLTRLPADDALGVATGALADALIEPELSLWARPDRELGVTILACEWPAGTDVDEATRLDEALRDLVVMCRVRSEVAGA